MSEKCLALSPLCLESVGCHSACGKDSLGIGLHISHDGVRCHLSGMMGHGFGRWSLTSVFWIHVCSEVGYFGGFCERKLSYKKRTTPVFFLSD